MDEKDKLEKDRLENARTGYQAAVSLWVYEGTLIWSKFTAMVYANTIVIATIGLLITNRAELRFLRNILAGLGLVLCLAWFAILKRSFDYHNYWVYSARDLEGILKPVETVTRGALVAKGEQVEFERPNKFPYQRSRVGPKVEHIAYLVIGLFGLIYVVILCQC